MAKFTVRVKANISITYNHKFLLDPKNFLDCLDTDEVLDKLDTLTEEALDNDLICDANIDNIDNAVYENYISDSNTVDDFINEWKKLKSNDNSKSN